MKTKANPAKIPMNKQPIKADLKNLKKLAGQISKTLRGGEVLALIGPLGSGKTTFTKFLGKELKIKNPIASPTFILMQSFPAKLKNGSPIEMYHLDLYRTKKFKEIKALGLTEIWQNKNHITVIEWADKIKKYLPKNTLYLKFLN